MNLLSQRGEVSTSRMEKLSRLGEETEAALTGAKAAPASSSAAELRSWSVRITLGIHRLEVLAGVAQHFGDAARSTDRWISTRGSQ